MAAVAHRNWWKVGFFLVLLVAEVLREMFVVVSASHARPLVREQVLAVDGYVSAEGRWVRTDGGEALVPQATTISCFEDRGECIESGYQINGLDVSPASVTIFPAVFDEQTVTYRNEFPACVSYLTTIDLRAEEAYRTRLAKEGIPEDDNLLCADIPLEQRMEMQLAGWDHPSFYIDPTEGHFLPVASLLRFLFGGAF